MNIRAHIEFQIDDGYTTRTIRSAPVHGNVGELSTKVAPFLANALKDCESEVKYELEKLRIGCPQS